MSKNLVRKGVVVATLPIDVANNIVGTCDECGESATLDEAFQIGGYIYHNYCYGTTGALEYMPVRPGKYPTQARKLG